MKLFQKILTRLLIIYIGLALLVWVLKKFTGMGLDFNHAALLLTGAFLIACLVGFVFVRGLAQDPKKRIVTTLTAITLKFVLFIALLLAYVLITKNKSWEFLLTFFILYLAFTSFLLITFVSVQKNNRE